ERQRMYVNGIMLVSTVLNFETISFARGNDLPYVLYLPSYAATAWYHKKLPADLQKLPVSELVARAEAFAAEDYNNALLRGASLAAERRAGTVQPWNWGEQNRYLNVAETLAESLTRNPFLKVHVSSGYFDMATPWLATHYTFSHLGVDPALAKNITLDDYTAGHMMYLNFADLKKQKADLARFIQSASGR